ncbi:uncharacterized protein LAJ45_03657 [Morchella importuna]|uniref:uncharacterized protein n=1 Tax=Morchella importuna TaxID=1174673 RepID=UPI001E8D2AE8|nr:uncharacterized protein LAJ45_03657 [Morchella importuna]KAH8152231.1 hypothetical protein LAJ45_03657 [Morchella importuna]
MRNPPFEGYSIAPGDRYPHLIDPSLPRPSLSYINSLNEKAYHPSMLNPMHMLSIRREHKDLEELLVPDVYPIITYDHITNRPPSSSPTSYAWANNYPASATTSDESIHNPAPVTTSYVSIKNSARSDSIPYVSINNPTGSIGTSYVAIDNSSSSVSSLEDTVANHEICVSTSNLPTHLILPDQSTINPITPEPSASERSETYAYYLSHHPRLSRQMIQEWFLQTYQRQISTSQVNSIIHTCGGVPQPRSSHRRDIPRGELNYEEARERERVLVWRWYTKTRGLEGKKPGMSRITSWWEGADGGRMLGISTLSGILTIMRQRQDAAEQVGKAAKEEDNTNEPGSSCGEEIKSAARDTWQATNSLKRLAPEDWEDNEDLVGPWCKPGKEAEEALEQLLQRQKETGHMYPGTYMLQRFKPRARAQAKRVKVTPPPKHDQVISDHHDIEIRTWNWWRRHRDRRRISTANIVTKLKYYWVDLEKTGPTPDFDELAESLRIKHNLVTNEGGPYPLDMVSLETFLRRPYGRDADYS